MPTCIRLGEHKGQSVRLGYICAWDLGIVGDKQ